MKADETVLAAGYARCAALTRERAKSFHFASAFLPDTKRRGVFALYAYCRHADDLVDERGDRPVTEVRRELAALDALVAALPDGPRPTDPLWWPLHDTVQRHRVPVAPLRELLVGMAHDLEPVAVPDAPHLLAYCHQVAGVVGLMLGPLLGARSQAFDEAGAALGTAMQLTNVLRDVAEDFAAGRVYLPANELARFGLGRDDLARGVVTPAWRDFMRFQIERARRYYAEGDRVVGLFPKDGSQLTVRLMQRTYAGILDAIEARDYDVFSHRASVGTAGKLRILGTTLLRTEPGALLPRLVRQR